MQVMAVILIFLMVIATTVVIVGGVFLYHSVRKKSKGDNKLSQISSPVSSKVIYCRLEAGEKNDNRVTNNRCLMNASTMQVYTKEEIERYLKQ